MLEVHSHMDSHDFHDSTDLHIGVVEDNEGMGNGRKLLAERYILVVPVVPDTLAAGESDNDQMEGQMSTWLEVLPVQFSRFRLWLLQLVLWGRESFCASSFHLFQEVCWRLSSWHGHPTLLVVLDLFWLLPFHLLLHTNGHPTRRVAKTDLHGVGQLGLHFSP